MWPLAIFLALVVGFYWFTFMFTLWFWFNAIFALIKGHFIRAAIWGSLGYGMWLWWHMGGEGLIASAIPDPWAFDRWLKGSAWVVGIAALITFARWRKRQQATQAVSAMPAWTAPADAVGNTAPVIEVEYKRLPN